MCRRLDLPVRDRHITSGGDMVPDPMRWTSEEMRAWPAVTGVYDRFTLLGEPVYGPIMRGRLYDEFMSSHYMALLQAFVTYHPLVIYCLPPPGVVKREFLLTAKSQPRWLREASAGQRDGIYAAYFSQMMWLEVMMPDRTLRWDWSHPNADNHFESIINRARLTIATYGRA
jgi:hypothetical protein